jgi:MYXO-CTERM domain-containing protein
VKTLAIATLLVLFAAPALGEITLIDLPLDDGTVPSYFTVQAGMSVGSETEAPKTYVKTWDLSESTEWPNSPWFYRPKIDLKAANGDAYVDASAPGATVEFDVRYVQVGVGTDGSQPYDNCWFGIQIFSWFGPQSWAHKDWWWGGAFNGVAAQGAWTHITLDLADTAGNVDFDLTQLSFIEWHSSNNRHQAADHLDIMNFRVASIPEPGVFLLAGFGLLALWRRRRR